VFLPNCIVLQHRLYILPKRLKVSTKLRGVTTQKMARSSETSAALYQTIWRYPPPPSLFFFKHFCQRMHSSPTCEEPAVNSFLSMWTSDQGMCFSKHSFLSAAHVLEGIVSLMKRFRSIWPQILGTTVSIYLCYSYIPSICGQ
jgi:hypothetical protein